MTTRSGRMKSPMALPSRRNSGLEATSKSRSRRVALMISAMRRLVPTGTVDLVTITAYPDSACATCSAAATTYVRSAWPPPRPDGEDPRLGVLDAGGEIAGEREPPGCHIPLHQLVEAGLVDRHVPGMQS